MTDIDGLLARGRGAGYLAALERGRSASDAVLRCVLEDPRWDRQIESRADYYASLLIKLGASAVQPIVDRIEQGERDDVWLAHDVLLQLAWRGHLGALAAVIERVRTSKLDASDLEEIGGYALVEQVFALAGRSLPPPEPPPSRPRPRLTLAPSLDVARLVALVTGPASSSKVSAARQLGELDYPALIPSAEAFLRSECGIPFEQRRLGTQQRRAWTLYLESLPATRTLELARRWFLADWPLSMAAEHVLARHAEPEDRAMLEAAGAKALAEREVYRLCSIVEALTCLADPASIPLLGAIYCETNYSYARERACIALLDHHAHADAQALLLESLWDCEQYIRASACEGVEPSAAAARLHELEADEFEDDEVRDAARNALEHR